MIGILLLGSAVVGDDGGGGGRETAQSDTQAGGSGGWLPVDRRWCVGKRGARNTTQRRTTHERAAD